MSPTSSSSIGDVNVTDWSWILQYLSETDEDLLNENALFIADWNPEVDEETERLLLMRTMPKLSPLPSSSSKDSWVLVFLVLVSLIWLVSWCLDVWSESVFLVGNKEASEKSTDFDLRELMILIFATGYWAILAVEVKLASKLMVIN